MEPDSQAIFHAVFAEPGPASVVRPSSGQAMSLLTARATEYSGRTGRSRAARWTALFAVNVVQAKVLKASALVRVSFHANIH